MKSNDSNDDPKLPDNDPVWKLLDRARRTEPSPAFVQNVVRKARQLGSGEEPLWQRWLGLLRQPAFAMTVAATAIVVIVAVLSMRGPQENPAGGPPLVDSGGPAAVAPIVDEVPSAPTEIYSFADQVEDIDYLGELVAVTDPGMLDEQMMADLLY